MELFEKQKRQVKEVKEEAAQNEAIEVAESAAPSMIESILSPTELPIKDEFIEAVTQVEKRLEFLDRLKSAVLKLTRATDWVNFGGSAYLCAQGAERLAQMFGINFRILEEPQKVDLEDGHFYVIIKGEFEWKGRKLQDYGIRSSKDIKYKNLPPDQVKVSDVIKDAYGNLIARGISRMLGIRGYTVEEIEGVVGPIKKTIGFKKKEDKDN